MHYDTNAVLLRAEELGDGWSRAEIRLDSGDTAESGTSTKWFLAGPGAIEYLIHATGWIVRPDASVTRTYTRSA